MQYFISFFFKKVEGDGFANCILSADLVETNGMFDVDKAVEQIKKLGHADSVILFYTKQG